MHCTNCGSTLLDSARFCSNCGAPSNSRASSASTPPPRPGTGYGTAIIAAIAIVALLIVLGAVAQRSTIADSGGYQTGYNSFANDLHGAINGGLSADCTPEQFKIKEQNGTNEYGFLTVVGVVHNGCGESAGVQLKLSQYDSHGHLVATDDQWPASVSNIGAHQDYQFKVMATAPDSAVKYSLAPVNVQRW